MVDPDIITIEVAYAEPQEQVIISLEVPTDTTIQQAIEISGILQRFPNIDLTQNKVGIFGKLQKLNKTLRAYDRVEIYRALIADPKEIRRQRAAQGKTTKKGQR